MSRRIFSALTLALTLTASLIAVADDKTSLQKNWEPLQDDVSRAELFSYVVKAKTEDAAIPLGTEGPVSAPLKGNFIFPHDANIDDATGFRRVDSIFGIDISHYTDSTLDLSSLRRQRVEFVYAKATQGTKYGDKKFPEYWSVLADQPANIRVLRGAYHFLSASDDGHAQADSFLKYVEKAGGFQPNDLPPCVDLEWDVTKVGQSDRWLAYSPDEIIDITLAWLQRVEAATGKIPMIYTNRAWWRSAIKSEAKFSRLEHYKIWIADYSGSNRVIEIPAVPNRANAHVWQFTASSHLGDYSKDLDANIYKGSRDQFAIDMQVSRSVVADN
ncbi:glycoside hydrolase [Rhizobium leguminosarum]|uniref:GH25 family lysozyme n=1 Tax=Rhizobium ruizarguesonis TaxID=2081791 RepID=UPI0013B6D531|nr:GH25 family lysozyme [Rhizobium ruizarguesonis]NEJ17648.1 glycoside hydrolase [Rhizobium ruizarguesonis]NEK31548.1 glycoside hydrolase [Rhizobium ruizarguesonis]